MNTTRPSTTHLKPQDSRARRRECFSPSHGVVPAACSPAEAGCRRALDILVAGGLLVVLALPMLLVALLVKLTSRGPALYKQQRVGLGGQPFVMLKFRTMYLDAEAQTGPIWSKPGDRRCTALGNFLRRTSIDELPQLLNVLRGDMSMIGPRPERPYFVEKFSHQLPAYPQRLAVRPGISGWAQVNGWRGATSLEKRLEFDLHYIRNRSLAFDLEIMLLTPLRVLVANDPNPEPTARVKLCTPLLLAVGLAAVLQAIYIARTPTISADGIIFIDIARQLPDQFLETVRTEDQHPGYPVMLLAATRLVQAVGYRVEPEAWMVGGVAVSYVCGLLCVCAVWLLVRTVFDTRIANVSAFVFAVLPVPCHMAADAHSDIPHLLFYALAVTMAAAGIVNGRPAALAGAGVASGIAYWIRPEGLEVFVVALVALAWQAFRAGWTWRRLGVACGALTGATVVVAAPYAILAGKITSKQLPFAKPYPVETFVERVAIGTQPLEGPLIKYPAPAEPEAGPESMESSASRPTEAPSDLSAAPNSPPAPTTATAALEPSDPYSPALVVRIFGRALSEFIESMCQGMKYVFIPFYLVGHVAMMRRHREPIHVVFLSLLAGAHFAALLALFFLSGYIAHRHVLPLVLLAMPLTGLGIVFVGEQAASRLRARPAVGVLATFGLACLVVIPYTIRPTNREFEPVINATEWVASHAVDGAGVICNSPYVGFYSQMPTTILGPDAASVDEALSASPAGVDYSYVVLHVGAHDYRPEWLTQVERRFRRVRMFPDATSDEGQRKVLVFEAIRGHARRDAEGTKS